ncbi:MAG TPA: hypothetical protein PKD10_19255 [Paracoccaceae bacterium]|mgnify:CR=1 FL=1|jgi:hypothetical protein|nr:hypothetical protein [Paracoccaceae bacterium]
MSVVADPLAEILKRHGIKDADAYLQEKGEDAGMFVSPDPDVVARGNVQLMKKRLVTREDVKQRLASLRFL